MILLIYATFYMVDMSDRSYNRISEEAHLSNVCAERCYRSRQVTDDQGLLMHSCASCERNVSWLTVVNDSIMRKSDPI